MIGDDQPFRGNERAGASIDSAYSVDKALAIGTKEALRVDLKSLFLEIDAPNFADRKHPFVGTQFRYQDRRQRNQCAQRYSNLHELVPRQIEVVSETYRFSFLSRRSVASFSVI